MVMEDDHSAPLEPREPTVEDLRNLCRELNQRGAKYLVIGGFAMRAVNYIRQTMDIDLLVSGALENEARIFSALSTLPDNAVKELKPGELQAYEVIRVADEIVVDLMRVAGGITYEEALKDIVIHSIGGVEIPFASPRLLYRMKSGSQREKDAPDLY
jgi:hypothetical protein